LTGSRWPVNRTHLRGNAEAGEGHRPAASFDAGFGNLGSYDLGLDNNGSLDAGIDLSGSVGIGFGPLSLSIGNIGLFD